jgi:hypothetical protein
MCKCIPEIRTPFCGKPGCEWPAPKLRIAADCDLPPSGEYFLGVGETVPEWLGDLIVTVSGAGVTIHRSHGAAEHR